MLTVPGYPLWSNNNDGITFNSNEEDRKITDVVKVMTKYVTILTATAGFGNFYELNDTDKKYLFDKTWSLIDSLNELIDIFQFQNNEILDEKE